MRDHDAAFLVLVPRAGPIRICTQVVVLTNALDEIETLDNAGSKNNNN